MHFFTATNTRSKLPQLDTGDPALQKDSVRSPSSCELKVSTDLAESVDRHTVKTTGGKGNLRILSGALLLLLLVAFAAAWQWTPLKDWLDLDRVARFAVSVRESPSAPLIVVGGYIIGGLLSFPATILIVATAITFGPLTGFVYALAGCVSSAVCCYGVGRMLGRDAVQRFAGERINRLSRQLAERGLIAIMIVRLAPVAPFTMMNVAAGASHIKFWDFTFGTIFGMAPGLFAMTLFGDSLEGAIRRPSLNTFVFLAALLIAIIAVNIVFRKWLTKRDHSLQIEKEIS